MATSAAMMIYLNKSCFNGIYRVNKQGRFNVPYGTRDKIMFDHESLIESSNILQNAQILCQDFETTINMAQEGVFIFCDPHMQWWTRKIALLVIMQMFFHGKIKFD